MRALLIFLVSLGLVAAAQGGDVSGRIVKVLPFLLDQQGRKAVSPSLFDRDAYQAYLRDHTNEISGVRFDILWSATMTAEARLLLRVELRGSGLGTNNLPQTKTLELPATPVAFRQWTTIPLAGKDYKNFGQVTAWRVSLWDYGRLLSEQKSYLW
jgi:hypothetical protein